MTNRFHLAVPTGDLSAAVAFYCDVLGCAKGNSEFKYPDAWVDINFWGNKLTLHATDLLNHSLGNGIMSTWVTQVYRISVYIWMNRTLFNLRYVWRKWH